jgi:D-tagatose-1,6-bisphosphate aldolase subunit GatZ/KbaZ
VTVIMNLHPLQKLIQHHKDDYHAGIYSVCSANPHVIENAINFAGKENSYLLIESTSNQVDQYGGYTGMKPEDFKQFVHNKAADLGFSIEKLILGGDHLGPNVWQNEPSAAAMEKAAVQIEAYVKAGFTKIHLDTSMPCKDDQLPLATEVVAKRAAFLCQVAERTNNQGPLQNPLVYIIGSEVPVPGGAHDQLEELVVSKPDDVQETIQLTENSFYDLNLQQAWEKVIGVVVQPGVEFSNWSVVKYDPLKAKELSQAIENYSNLCYEAHSTDYQAQSDLEHLVKDHFAILKVGPALTFALREAIFALAYIENELYSSPGMKEKRSNIFSVIDSVMDKNPQFWKKYYSGEPQSEYYNRRFGLSDRIRYYLPDEQIKNALKRLLENLTQVKIPDALLSQFLPEQFKKIKNAEMECTPNTLISDKINQVLNDYSLACSAKNNYSILTS